LDAKPRAPPAQGLRSSSPPTGPEFGERSSITGSSARSRRSCERWTPGVTIEWRLAPKRAAVTFARLRAVTPVPQPLDRLAEADNPTPVPDTAWTRPSSTNHRRREMGLIDQIIKFLSAPGVNVGPWDGSHNGHKTITVDQGNSKIQVIVAEDKFAAQF